jgi:hypothetical protein
VFITSKLLLSEATTRPDPHRGLTDTDEYRFIGLHPPRFGQAPEKKWMFMMQTRLLLALIRLADSLTTVCLAVGDVPAFGCGFLYY